MHRFVSPPRLATARRPVSSASSPSARRRRLFLEARTLSPPPQAVSVLLSQPVRRMTRPEPGPAQCLEVPLNPSRHARCHLLARRPGDIWVTSDLGAGKTNRRPAFALGECVAL